jgi:hypothetical protein
MTRPASTAAGEVSGGKPDTADGTAPGTACRDPALTPWWARPAARWLARREARVLQVLAGVPGVPPLISWDGSRLLRAWLPGKPMQVARPRHPAYFRQALQLLRRVHGRGVAHNDLAKEPNWLVLPPGHPGLIDFELAWCDPARGLIFRMLAREDLRHLLKHKRCYCPGQLTARQRRILARPAPAARVWGCLVRPLARVLGPRRWRPGGTVFTPSA